MVWLNFRVPSLATIGRLKLNWTKPELRVESDDWNEIMNYALERAKDELLAEFKVKDSLSYLSKLLTKEGLYDYFTRLGIKPDSELYNDLWKKYRDTLKFAAETAEYLLRAYREFGLKERLDLIRWVLAQIPLRDWDKQITNSAFWEEANYLLLINGRFTSERIPNDWDFLEAREELGEELRKNQSHSLLPIINKYRPRLKCFI